MVRAATAAEVYAHPRAAPAGATDMNSPRRVVTGFYVVVPDGQVGTAWMPGL